MLSSHTVLIRTFNSLKASMNTCVHHRRGKMTELRLYSAEVQRLTLLLYPRSGELRTQKLKSHLVRTQSLNVLSFKPGVGQYIAIRTTLTVRDFFLISPSSVHSSAFFPDLFRYLLCWLWLTHGSCVGLQNKIGQPAGCRFPC